MRNAGREVLAGVTLLAIAVPLNIGYAQIAGLPATAGLYAMILPSILYAFVVSSRQLVASPDAAAAALVASSIGGLALAGSENYLVLALAQAIVCGVIFLLCSAFKLGFLANFLSKPILVGFVSGLALDILVGQFAKMFGIKIFSGGEFVEKAGGFVTGLPTTNPWSVLIAVASVAVLVVGRRISPVVPWALLVLVASTIVVFLTPLHDSGVAVLGAIDAGPPTLGWPMLDWKTWLQLVPSAVALTMVAMAEGLLVVKRYGEKNGYRTNPNRDLLALGVVNIASGATGGFAVGSSTSRTAAMDQTGSRTQLPSIVAAVCALFLVIFGTALLANIPAPAIGAIVAVAVVPLLGVSDFISLWRLQKFEFAVAVVCFLGAVLVGPIAGIGLAFVLSLINLARRAASPAIDILSINDSPAQSLLSPEPTVIATAPGVLVYRFAAPLFFANVQVFDETIRKAITAVSPAATRINLVIDLEAVTDIDVTGAEGFGAVLAWLAQHDITVHFSRLRPDLRRVIEHYGLLADVRVFASNREAVAALDTGR
ncbi:SulP family inorganic anion transporter [Cryobacterium sp. MLB-32]|uniref:SulP family inorganic anion transporter n=1 Tax=Cryobacterium sp. MLB-32 TaxID=1529318 RepID=UPI000A67C32B|nr:SulP family inorganic anion transporter [Cryobacterium sp. MLB-32]